MGSQCSQHMIHSSARPGALNGTAVVCYSHLEDVRIGFILVAGYSVKSLSGVYHTSCLSTNSNSGQQRGLACGPRRDSGCVGIATLNVAGLSIRGRKGPGGVPPPQLGALA